MLNTTHNIEGLSYTSGRIGLVYSTFNIEIVEALKAGFYQACDEFSIPHDVISEVSVPGAFELPLACHHLIMDADCDVVVALGSIIKGDTDHYTAVCRACTDGINRVILDTHVPIIFEVLMTLNLADAQARASLPTSSDLAFDWKKNKGYVSCLNALELLRLYGVSAVV